MAWFIFIALEMLRNFTLIKWLEIRPHYGWSRVIRFFGWLGFLFYRFPDPASVGFPVLVYTAFQVSSFYLLFDLILNILRKKPIFYRGKNSGELDKLPDTKYYLLKLGTLIVFILSSIAIYYGKG